MERNALCLSWPSRSPCFAACPKEPPFHSFWLLLYLDRTAIEEVTVPDGEFLDGSMHATLFLNGPFSPEILRPTTSPPAFQLLPLSEWSTSLCAGLDGFRATTLENGCMSASKLETQPSPVAQPTHSSPWPSPSSAVVGVIRRHAQALPEATISWLAILKILPPVIRSCHR